VNTGRVTCTMYFFFFSNGILANTESAATDRTIDSIRGKKEKNYYIPIEEHR